MGDSLEISAKTLRVTELLDATVPPLHLRLHHPLFFAPTTPSPSSLPPPLLNRTTPSSPLCHPIFFARTYYLALYSARVTPSSKLSAVPPPLLLSYHPLYFAIPPPLLCRSTSSTSPVQLRPVLLSLVEFCPKLYM